MILNYTLYYISHPNSHHEYEQTQFFYYISQEWLKEAIINYPDTCAVLVRRHGVYVWGDTWEKTKTMLVM